MTRTPACFSPKNKAFMVGYHEMVDGLLGSKVCWDYDVTDSDLKTVLLVASTILLLLCGWVWYKIIKDPKLSTSSGKPVAAIIITLTIIVGLIILIFATSPYWGPLFGHPTTRTTTTVYHQ